MAKILVVDDQAPNRELIVTLLQYAGHSLSEASDGSAALDQVRAVHPDLVICDILMPTMDGYEFVRQLRADPDIADIEVVFYTATFMEREARRLANSCGVSHVMLKPCEPQEILRMVEVALTTTSAPVPLQSDSEFDREHLRLLTDKLAAKVIELELTNQRLSALTDLNLQLASEHDPYVLLDKVCRGARELTGARGAILAVRVKNGTESIHLTTWGLAADQTWQLKQQPGFDAGLLGRTMADGKAQRFVNPGGDPRDVGLPDNYPLLKSGVIAPILSLHRTYGWVLLIDKLGAAEFADEDQRMLAIHAAQAGRIYENGSLYKEVKRTADQLAIEVAERKRAAQELREANESLEQRVTLRTTELREMIEGLESFNRSVSHDLRGPLGGIAGAARMARDFMAEDKREKADRFMEAIATEAERTTKMVDALLSLARTGNAPVRKREVDMTALVHEVVQTLAQARGNGPLPVVVGPLPTIQADPDLMRQVLINLIGNALKFAAEVEAPRVEVGATGPSVAERPVFHVRDNGIGFDPQQAGQLFKPFHRLHAERFQGTGVGLSIVKRIVDRHEGKVWADSAPGQGATFYFSV
jgi:signal transduction histidine kinase/CheY-like chemotaxis protein